MHRNAWKRACAQRLVERIEMEPGEAAATAESLTEIEVELSGDDPDEWDSPITAADLHVASMELNREALHPAPQSPEAYNQAIGSKFGLGRPKVRP